MTLLKKGSTYRRKSHDLTEVDLTDVTYVSLNRDHSKLSKHESSVATPRIAPKTPKLRNSSISSRTRVLRKTSSMWYGKAKLISKTTSLIDTQKYLNDADLEQFDLLCEETLLGGENQEKSEPKSRAATPDSAQTLETVDTARTAVTAETAETGKTAKTAKTTKSAAPTVETSANYEKVKLSRAHSEPDSVRTETHDVSIAAACVLKDIIADFESGNLAHIHGSVRQRIDSSIGLVDDSNLKTLEKLDSALHISNEKKKNEQATSHCRTTYSETKSLPRLIAGIPSFDLTSLGLTNRSSRHFDTANMANTCKIKYSSKNKNTSHKNVRNSCSMGNLPYFSSKNTNPSNSGPSQNYERKISIKYQQKIKKSDSSNRHFSLSPRSLLFGNFFSCGRRDFTNYQKRNLDIKRSHNFTQSNDQISDKIRSLSKTTEI